ncbi:MAG TPA: MFS transporter [Steroidobacter sp.]|uniref:MFS transporter n=1 Tax=Steroidobacter sp. TaxID=1978227 RepID=UPI002EDB2718
MSVAEMPALAERRWSVDNYPWMLIGLLWVVAFLNASDRSILVAVMPQLRQEFGLTPEQLALINSTFFWVYAVAAFVFGRLGDGTRRSWVIIGGLAFWSVATCAVSLSVGFAMLMAFRSLVALGEATYYPTATALISDWHRSEMRSRALSIHQTAVLAGTGFGALAAGYIADRYGWRAAFVIFGAVGLVWCLLLLKVLRDAPVRAAPAQRSLLGPLRIVVSKRPALMLCAVFFLANGASTGVTVWAPTYVHDALGLDLASSAFYGAATISIAAFFAVPVGGFLADALAGKTPIGRFYMLAIGLTLAGVLLMPLITAGSAATIGLVLLTSSFGKGLFDGCIYAAMHDVMPREARASAVGLMTMCGFIGAGLTPLLVAVAARTFGMAAGLTSLCVLYFIAVGILLMTRGVTHRVVVQERAVEMSNVA